MNRFILQNITQFDSWLQTGSFKRVIKIIQNHHTYSPSYSDFKGNNHLSILEHLEKAHIERGYNEIGQHITTFPDGSIALGRPFDKIPAGIKGINQSSICIEHLGNFDEGNDEMTDLQRKTILKVNALLCRTFNLEPSINSIVYHHWYDLNTGKRNNGIGASKSCPGTNFFGGNTLEDAEEHFIAPINRAMAIFEKGPVLPEHIIAEISSPNGMNVRNAPAITAKKLSVVQAGILIRIYEVVNGWCRVHPTEMHWIHKNGISTREELNSVTSNPLSEIIM